MSSALAFYFKNIFKSSSKLFMDFAKGLVRWNIESIPSKPKWSVDDMPDLTGRVAIVTGGNSGIGKEIVKELLRKNAIVYMAARNQGKADKAIDELKKQTGKEAFFLELDLADLKSIERSFQLFKTKETELHLLFNNGGVMWAPINMLTAQGYDLQFGTNVLGHYYFTKLLIPLLKEGSESSPDGKARVVTVSSIMRHMCSCIDYETLRDTRKRKRAGTKEMYNQSKFGDALLSKELARRYEGRGIVFVGCAPGILKTDLLRHANKAIAWLIKTIYMYDPSYGALTPLYAGTSPETVDANGRFCIPWARLAESAGAGVDDPKEGEELWRWLEEQVKGV